MLWIQNMLKYFVSENLSLTCGIETDGKRLTDRQKEQWMDRQKRWIRNVMCPSRKIKTKRPPTCWSSHADPSDKTSPQTPHPNPREAHCLQPASRVHRHLLNLPLLSSRPQSHSSPGRQALSELSSWPLHFASFNFHWPSAVTWE